MVAGALTPALVSAVTAPVSFSSLQPHTIQCLTPGFELSTAPVRFWASTGELSVPTSTTGSCAPEAVVKAVCAALTRSTQPVRSCLYALKILVSAAAQPEALNRRAASLPTSVPIAVPLNPTKG